MSRVLVTGASGFIGRNALAPLLAAGHEVHAISTTGPPAWSPPGVTWHRGELLSDPRATVAAVRPRLLLHLAWYTAHGSFWTSPENLRWVAATLELVRAFAATGGERLVAAGSCAEYEWGLPGPCVEGETPLRPATLYGSCKDATRAVLEAAAAELSVEVAWGRIFFVYGPREAPGRLVAAVARALLAGERVPTGDGRQIRDFLHVADVAGAFAALLHSPVTGPVNVASGQGVPLAEVIDAIAAATGRPDLVDVGALPPRPGDPHELVADVARLRQEIAFRPTISLYEGIERTVSWWRRTQGQMDRVT